MTGEQVFRGHCTCSPIVHRGRTVAWRGDPSCPVEAHQAPPVESLQPGEIARTEHMVLTLIPGQEHPS